jgi:hypothetical protein
MAPWWWSWVLMSVGVTGLWLAGRKNRLGWAIGFGSQVLWLAYSLSTRQWGFLVSCLFYGFVHARNFLRWRAEARVAEQQREEVNTGWPRRSRARSARSSGMP